MVDECDPNVETAKTMAQRMIGEELKSVTRRAGSNFGEPRIVVEGLDLPPEDLHGIALKNVSIEVRAGEVLGIAGVAGNGQNELLLALSGERLAERPEAIVIDGEPVGALTAGKRWYSSPVGGIQERSESRSIANIAFLDILSVK